MKKLITLLLVLALMGCAALAEAQAFSFRNGVAWGMTQDEVLAAEGNPNYEAFDAGDGSMTGIEIDDVTAAGVEAELMYNFMNGSLVMCGYEFDADDVTIDALAEQLTGKYGPESEADYAAIVEIYNIMFGPGRMTEEFLSGRSPRCWQLEDGTILLLIAYSDDDIDLAYMDGTGLRASQSVDEPAPALTPDGL
ncbi:MAG: hypothetical protein Q4C10_11615 [Clostridia bacterium]|nr:hypothetical protein [Clostridia bacterium]